MSGLTSTDSLTSDFGQPNVLGMRTANVAAFTVNPPWHTPSAMIRVAGLPGPTDRYPVDPDAPYARHFWLPIIGALTWSVGQRLAEQHADGESCTYEVAELGRTFGVSARIGRHAKIVATLHRLELFSLARWTNGTLEVRTAWPLLSAKLVSRLPLALQEAHALGQHPWCRRAESSCLAAVGSTARQ